MEAPELTESLLRRYWAKVDKRGPDECWPWTGGASEHGYGKLHPDGKTGSPLRAHRVGHLIATGEWPETVLHTCDTPPCQNPAHLVSGDQEANLADMRAKGRQASGSALSDAIRGGIPRGERHYKAKLTDAQREEIKVRYAAGGVTQQELADEYGIGRPHVSFIVSGRRRTHLSGATQRADDRPIGPVESA